MMDIEKDGEAPHSLKSGSNSQAIGVDGQSTQTESSPDHAFSLSSKAQAVLENARAETGFESYLAYLKFHSNDYQSLEKLVELFDIEKESVPLDPNVLGRLFRESGPGQLFWPGTVLNLTRCGGLSINKIGTPIIEALCHPPDDADLQILLWNIPPWFYMVVKKSKLFDFLGLSFQLDPRVFKAMLAISHFDGRDPDRYHPTHATMGDIIATTCSSRHTGNNIPVVVIAGRIQSGFVSELGDKLDNIRQSPPFDPSPSTRRPQNAVSFHTYYPLLLTELLKNNQKVEEDFTTLSLVCFLPLFQMRLHELRESCYHHRGLLNGKQTNQSNVHLPNNENASLYFSQTQLRQLTEETENDWCSFVRYIKSQHRYDWSKGQLYRDLEDEFEEMMAGARRVESQMRDYLQLEAGKLGLEESRKSIEMSNRQIEEAKRGKPYPYLGKVLLTVLSENM